MKLRQKEKQKTVDNGKEKLRLIPFENEIPCETIVRFELRGRKAAAFMLRRGQGESESFQFIFGFETRGVHSTLKPDQVDPIFDAIENGLKDLPLGEKLTLHFGSFSSDRARQNELSKIALNSGSAPLQFLLLGEKKRVAELTRSGLRKPKFLKLYVSYTVDPTTTHSADWIEKILSKGEGMWNKFTGVAASLRETKYDEMLDKAFTDGFIRWEQLLATKMGLQVDPMAEGDLWESLWERFNPTEPPPIPQILTYGQDGVDEMSESDIHLTSHLFPAQESLPYADRAFVHVKGNYVAPLVFIDKPGGWSNKESELGYLWQIFARDAVFDTECFCQITRANDAIIRENMSRVTRQTIAAQNLSSKNASVDVGANIRQRKAISAQEELYEGALPLNLAVVFLVHRKDLESLDSACRYLQNCFRRPAWVDWEKEYAWKIWLQTLPTCWEKLLSMPYDRRLTYLSGEAPGFMSLVQPSPVDKRGLELVTDQGGVPLHLDIYSQHRNLALFATTRAGKSVLVAGILSQGLARGIPTVVMDFPPSDAASTFKDFTRYVGGAYFDIGKESNNLLEVPDLSAFDDKEREERMVDFKDFVSSALMIMVFGTGESTTTADRMLKQAIRAVLIPALDGFFADAQMLHRYAEAHQYGVGSDAWNRIPTLNDFMKYFDEKGLDGLPEAVMSDTNTSQAINQIKRQLRFWVSSRVGRAIARPSTFKTDSLLLVFALRGLSDGDDASILALSAYSAVLRRTLSHKESICFIDEFSVLLEWNQIGALVARLAANGAKAGIRLILAAQDPNTLINSPSGPKIIQNVSTRLIGRIQPVAQQSFIDGLQVAPTIIARNAGKNFYPAKEGLYSQWLLDEQSTYTYVRYYSPPVLLAVVANNPHEAAARQAFREAYNDPFDGLSAFADELAASFREGRSINAPNVQRSTKPLEFSVSAPVEEPMDAAVA